MLPFFQKVVGVLNENNIPYMLSGSMAMSLYVVPRSTRDFDFIIHLRISNVDKFVQSFQDGYYCEKDSIIDAIRYEGMFNIIDHASGFKADFVILKDSPYRQEEFRRRVKMSFLGTETWIVSAEDLLISKLFWIQDSQSSIQKEDIKNLSELQNLDWDYINFWVTRLKLNNFGLLKL
jgi:hypothetical protein